jgi:hypothetical protein
MRRIIHIQPSNKKLDKIVYHCDSPTCLYAKSISLEHQNCSDDTYQPLVVEKANVSEIPRPIYSKEEPITVSFGEGSTEGA